MQHEQQHLLHHWRHRRHRRYPESPRSILSSARQAARHRESLVRREPNEPGSAKQMAGPLLRSELGSGYFAGAKITHTGEPTVAD